MYEPAYKHMTFCKNVRINGLADQKNQSTWHLYNTLCNYNHSPFTTTSIATSFTLVSLSSSTVFTARQIPSSPLSPSVALIRVSEAVTRNVVLGNSSAGWVSTINRGSPSSWSPLKKEMVGGGSPMATHVKVTFSVSLTRKISPLIGDTI